MSKLNGQVAVVTGASKGIGASVAKHFAAAGARVVVNYVSGKADAERVVAEILAKDGKAVAVQGDVSKAADVKRLFAEAKKAFGKVDVLVNNAAIFDFKPLEAVTEAEFHQQFDVNVLGSILAAQEAVTHFGPEGGSIINVSSVVSENPLPGSVVYAATKGAIDTITLALARELAPRRIRVNTIAPGPVETEGFHRVGLSGSEVEKQMIAQTPLGRLGRPEDIARAAVFLASSDAGWVTGERLTVAGGLR